MKKVKETVGIDVSKLTLDVHLHVAGLHQQFGNDQSGFKKIVAWVKLKGVKAEEVLFCFEHTGWYCSYKFVAEFEAEMCRLTLALSTKLTLESSYFTRHDL